MNTYKNITLTAIMAVAMGISGAAFANSDEVTRYKLMQDKSFKNSLSASQVQNLHDFFDYKRESHVKITKPLPWGFTWTNVIYIKSRPKEKS